MNKNSHERKGKEKRVKRSILTNMIVVPFLPFLLGIGVISIASSFAYCLIIGTPPNAIVYASGYLEPKDYLRVGIPMFFVANVVLLFLTGVLWSFRGFGTTPGF